MSFKKSFLGLFCILGMMSALPAHAQYGGNNLLSQNKLDFRFITIPEADDSMMHMMFYNPTPVQGCAQIGPFNVKQELRGISLFMDVTPPAAMPDRKHKNPHYDCSKGAQMAQTIVAINKRELIENGVTQITIKTADRITKYDMMINDDMIRLTPALPGTTGSMEYWFIPDNAVTLSVPMANEDIRSNALLLDQLRHIARLRNLTPIEDMKPGFNQHTGNVKLDNASNKQFVFIDEHGIFADSLKGNATEQIGKIETTEKFYGPNGAYDKPKALPVIASRPGFLAN